MAHLEVLANSAAAAATALGMYLLVRMANQHLTVRSLVKQIESLQADLAHEQTKRAAERSGRISAEQALRRLQVAAATGSANSGEAQSSQPGSAHPSGGSALAAFPFRPIGYLHSCFSTRNGTPRQPLLVPAARSVLHLSRGVPPEALEGLQQYSHCWVLYVFHANTDISKVLSGATQPAAGGSTFKAKVRVPRLDGGSLGVLATRSPHRPCPIGLSVAQVLSVDRGRLVLGGADIVDGSPVLDIKPYLPFCDALPGAVAPPWVAAEAEQEPLRLTDVLFGPGAKESIAQCWEGAQAAGGGGGASGRGGCGAQGDGSGFVAGGAHGSGGECSGGGSDGNHGGGGGDGSGGGRSSGKVKGRRAQRREQLYGSADEVVELVHQVLSRDIRSVHQRCNVQPAGQAARAGAAAVQTPAAPVPCCAAPAGGAASQAGGQGRYHVVLDGIDVSYNVTASGTVVVTSAVPKQAA